jgi:hypothetical protein
MKYDVYIDCDQDLGRMSNSQLAYSSNLRGSFATDEEARSSIRWKLSCYHCQIMNQRKRQPLSEPLHREDPAASLELRQSMPAQDLRCSSEDGSMLAPH